MIPQLALSIAIKEQGINVALSGDGADEIFGGYKRSMEYDSQYSDIFEELVFYHLPRLDKLMMAHTVELRSPFMSKPIIEFGLGLPYKYRINKHFLKEAFVDMIPTYIIGRKKLPLRTPFMGQDKKRWQKICIDTFREKEGWE
jgi:asparagine synthase (glutamine-hydrolysing)